MRIKCSNASTGWAKGHAVGIVPVYIPGDGHIDNMYHGIALNIPDPRDVGYSIYHHRIPWTDPTKVVDLWKS